MFLFSHLPYAMSGVNGWLNQNPQTQQMVQQMQNPYSVTGTTVPQNYWNGLQFNIPPYTMPAPKPTSTGPAIPASPIRTPGPYQPLPMQTEYGQDDNSE